VDGVTYGEVVEAGEHLPGMAALWDVAPPQERRDMVTLILQPEGLYYDTELKMIAAMKPQPAFLPVLRMLAGVVEYEETSGLLVTEHWSLRNRRVLNLVSVELVVLLVKKIEQTIAQVLVISKWERRKQQASDDSQDASRDRQTRSTAFSVSASSVFLLLAAYARTDMRRSQHTLCGGADD
jgi:hypothetical protein